MAHDIRDRTRETIATAYLTIVPGSQRNEG